MRLIFGTDDKYRVHKAKLAAARAEMRNASKEEHDRLEQKMLEETEREGVRAAEEAENYGRRKPVKAH